MTPGPSPQELLAGLRQSLARMRVDYERIVRDFGHVAAPEARERGHRFSSRSISADLCFHT